MTDIENIACQFQIKGTPSEVKPFGRGHIHKTYIINTSNRDDVSRYILQQINTSVFQDVNALMDNILHITSHLRTKLEKLPGHDPDMETLQLVPTRTGGLFHKDVSGGCWRMFLFIAGTGNFDRPKNPGQAIEAGKVTGRFLVLLDDLPFRLHNTLPRFHDLEFRMEQFDMALAGNVAKRKKNVTKETALIFMQLEKRRNLIKMMKEGDLPKRITHNDTKFNNILFNKYDKAICLIDLDTVMPGYVAYDFGDAIRTLANTAAEDEQNLDMVHFDLSLSEAYARGFLAETESFLTHPEKKTLPEAPLLMTFIIGLRFLTDYLNGDVYYRIQYPDHNLFRARCQFKLLVEMEGKYRQIMDIIES